MNNLSRIILFTLSLIAPTVYPEATHRLVNDQGQIKAVESNTIIADPHHYSNQVRVYFSPDDNIRRHLIKAIERERSSIKIAIFNLTDSAIAHALLQAHQKGILIEIITDPTCLKDRFNKITMLSNHGVPVYVYSTEHGTGLHSCMHHKFAIFDSNHKHEQYVWTGSFNFTKSACESNQENVVVIHQETTVKRFQDQFNRLKNRSQRLVSRTGPLLRNKEQ